MYHFSLEIPHTLLPTQWSAPEGEHVRYVAFALCFALRSGHLCTAFADRSLVTSVLQIRHFPEQICSLSSITSWSMVGIDPLLSRRIQKVHQISGMFRFLTAPVSSIWKVHHRHLVCFECCFTAESVAIFTTTAPYQGAETKHRHGARRKKVLLIARP